MSQQYHLQRILKNKHKDFKLLIKVNNGTEFQYKRGIL